MCTEALHLERGGGRPAARVGKIGRVWLGTRGGDGVKTEVGWTGQASMRTGPEMEGTGTEA